MDDSGKAEETALPVAVEVACVGVIVRGELPSIVDEEVALVQVAVEAVAVEQEGVVVDWEH